MIRAKYLLIFTLYGALTSFNTSYANDFSLSGYVKSYALAQDSITIENNDGQGKNQSIPSNFQFQNAVRLMASYLSANKGNIEVHYEVQPLYFSNSDIADLYKGENSLGLTGTVSVANNQYRYKDLKPVLTDVGDHVVVLQNLDRLNYQYSNKYGDLTIGRQVLSFGSARFINPTDIFIPFSLQTLNQEYRVGIDAIRYKADVGDFAVVDTGLVIGEGGKKENSAAFLRGKNSINGNDIEVMAIILDGAWLLGTGVERAIGDFGFWFETAYMDWHQKDPVMNEAFGDLVNNAPLSSINKAENNYWRTSIGSDYALNENIIVMIEYHYNGAGSSNVDDYSKLSTQVPYQKAGVYLYGEHYIIPALTWIASPLMSVNASAFYNLSDNSVFLNLTSEVSWTDNLYSDFGMQISHGETMQSKGSGEDITFKVNSEFGTYPTSIFASLRYYF